MQEDIIKLQEMVSYQQEEISRLSEELFLQQRLIDELRIKLATFQTQLEDVSDALHQSDNRPPPHY